MIGIWSDVTEEYRLSAEREARVLAALCAVLAMPWFPDRGLSMDKGVGGDAAKLPAWIATMPAAQVARK